MRKTFTTLKALIFSASVLMFASANAQVSYTQLITPIVVGEDKFTTIDLNGDGTGDIGFGVMNAKDEPIEYGAISGTFTGIYYTVGAPEETSASLVSVDADSPEGLAISYNAGETIDNTADYDFGGILYLSGTVTLGQIPSFPHSAGNFGVNQRYIGVSFEVDGDTHYGFILVVVNTLDKTITIKQYGYEGTADKAISAGATTTSIASSYVKENTTIKNINNTIVAEFVNSFNGKMEVVNMNGQVVKSTTVNGVASSVSMEGTPSGIYQVIVSGAEGFATEKVFVATR